MSNNKNNQNQNGDFPEQIAGQITYIGPKNSFEGKLVLTHRTIVEGAFIKGKIDSTATDSELVISAGSEIVGDIKAESLILNGTMQGKIISQKVSIQEKGVFTGEIETNRGLNIDMGAKILAKIRMKKRTKKK